MKSTMHTTGARCPGFASAVLAAALALAASAQAATLTVDTADDELNGNGDCSLREAITNANNDDQSGSTACEAGSGDDEIVFASELAGQTILLSIAGSGENGNSTGDLDVNDPDLDSVTITGPGTDTPGSIVLDGNGTDRIFDAFSPLGLKNLTVTGGGTVVLGGGIRSHPDIGLTLEHVDVRANRIEASVGTMSLRGGGMYLEGPALLDDVVVAGNTAMDDAVNPLGAGIYFGATTSEALGLFNSTITGNVAASNGDHSALGGGIYARPGSLLLDDNVVTDNRVEIDPASGSAEAEGGGIYFRGSGDLTVVDSVVRGNTARLAGTGSTVLGGGVMLLDSTFGSARIARSEISGNTLTTDGAAVAGGGLYQQTDRGLTLSNSTISGNRIDASGGLGGGGLFVGRGTVELNNVTVAANTVASPGGSGGGVLEDGGDVIASNTIVAGNTAQDGPDCAGPFISNDYNLIGDDSGCTITPQPGDLINRDPDLDALADNGGTTRTHALLEGSPAIDAGNPNPVMEDMPPACEPEDQRRQSRPSDDDGDGGAECDIGAFEGAIAAGSGESSGGNGGGGGGALGPAWLLLVVAAGLLRPCRRLRATGAIRRRGKTSFPC